MSEKFADYTFKEIIERPDRGADWLPLFAFEVTSHELVNWSKETKKKNPTLNASQLFPVPDTGCTLTAAEASKVNSAESFYVTKDLYGIFATIGYIATTYGRDGWVQVMLAP